MNFTMLNKKKRQQYTIVLIGSLVVCVMIVVLMIGSFFFEDKQSAESLGKETENGTEALSTDIQGTEEDKSTEIEEVPPPDDSNMVEDSEDPQHQDNGDMTQQSGADVKFEELLEDVNNQNTNEKQEITFGIDVSKYQGIIDWKQVSDAGVDFAMVRVGYRTLKTGEIVADSNAKYNMQEAQKYGIKVGAYFFSTAITKEEAKEEADWVTNYISRYRITYPVAYNCEGFEDSENRQFALNKFQRTDIAVIFLEQIIENGYSPMFYASKTEMENSAKWDMSRIEGKYKVWVAQYPTVPYPQTEKSTYSGIHDMWQYTNQGTVPGIKKPVDVNVAYFGFHNEEGPKNEGASEEVEADVEALMNFKTVNEVVTAKDRTNLRNRPSQGSESAVMYTLTNGETATRTGVSDSGWSRVIFNGKTYYAVSSFLTTDLNYQPPSSGNTESANGTEDGNTEGSTGNSGGEADTETGTIIKTQFVTTSDQVTAKEVVNLRNMPSTTNENSAVIAQLVHGEVITRTGINTDVGWSRVEYNGQILYCVSSFLEVVNETSESSAEEITEEVTE